MLKKLFAVDEKTAKQEQQRDKFSLHLLKNIYSGVKIPWGTFIWLTFAALAVYVVMGLSTSLSAKIVSGDFSDRKEIVYYAVFSLFTWLNFLVAFKMDATCHRLNSRVKNKLWRKILGLPAEYFDRETPGRVISRVTVDSDNASMPFAMFLSLVAVLAIFVGILLGSNGALNNPMSVWLGVGVAISVLGLIAAMLLMSVFGYLDSNRLANFTAFLSERLANIKLIKSSKSEKAEIANARRLVDARFKANLFYIFAYLSNYMACYALIFCTYIGGFIMGADLFETGVIENGSIIVKFYTYGASVGSYLLTIATTICAVFAAAGQSTQFAKIFDEREENITLGGEMPAERGDICMENADFSYDGEKKVLKGVTCTIQEGKVNAVIGTNGSGKSTLVKLIDRLYTAADSTMTLGGEKASEISLRAWRSKFGIVSQSASLFSGTIRSNILYGMEREVSEEELWQVIRMAGIEDILASHEEGLDFDVGINGSHLSGGEQQRIAIARAMIKNPDYLILDEATANLDAETAKKIEAGIDAIMSGRTVISIAHSFDAIKKADHIIVLDKGEIIGSGSHEALLDSCDFYARLYRAGFEL